VSHDDRPEVLDLGMVDEPDASPAEPSRSRPPDVRRRGLLVLAGVAVLGGGAALVRSRGSAPPATAATPTPTASPRPSPIRLPAGWVVMTQLPEPPLDGRRLDLFGFSDSAIVRVELATGRVTRTSMPALADVGLSFVPVRGGVLVHRDDGGATYLVPDGHGPKEAAPGLAGSGPMLPGPDLDHVWVSDASGGTPVLRLVGLDGRATGPLVDLPRYTAFQSVPDGGGYALVYGLGGAYWARPQGLIRVTTGAVMASGPTGWLVLDCDDSATCSAILVDRTGQRRTISGVVAPDAAAGIPVGPEGALSPDGLTAALYVGDPTRALRLVLVDLASGERKRTDLTLVGGAVSQSLVWSPDGRWLFGVDSSARMVAIDPRSGGLQLLVPDTIVPALPVVAQIAIRPV